MTYRETAPSARLARYVECYWWRSGTDAVAQRVLPDGCADLLFSEPRGEPVSLAVVGLMTKPLAVEQTAGCAYFGVRFLPGMAAAFLPEAAELTDKIEPLENIRRGMARVLQEQLAEAAHPQRRAAIFERWLRPLEAPDAARRALWQFHGALSQDALSERQFRRACAAQAGVSPKYLARILRFRRAVERLRGTTAQPSWAQFAAACGYYDQAHFIREFEEFAGGVTPGRFLQSLRAGLAVESGHHERPED